MAAATLFADAFAYIVDENGVPIVGAELTFFQAGTSTPAVVYTDSNLATAWLQPIVTNTAGQSDGPIYVPSEPNLKIVVVDENDVPVSGFPMDNWAPYAISGGSGGGTMVGVNVADYGADPTGFDDSLAAFDAAVEAAGDNGDIIWIPRGTYLLSDTWTIAGKGVRIIGVTPSGNSLSPVTLTFAEDADGIIFQYDAGNAAYSRLEGVRIVSDGTSTTGVGLTVLTHAFHAEHLVIESFGSHGIKVGGLTGNANSGSYSNIRCLFNGGNGVHLDATDANACFFYNIDCTDNDGYGYFDSNACNSVFGGQFDSNGTGAIRLEGGSGYLAGIYVENGSGDSLSFDSGAAGYTVILGNVASPTISGAIPTGNYVWKKNTVNNFQVNFPDSNADASNIGFCRIFGGTDAAGTNANMRVGAGGTGTDFNLIVRGTATFNTGTIADGAMVSTTVTVTGVAANNAWAYFFGHTNYAAGWFLSGSATASNTVTVTAMNKTGGNAGMTGTVTVWAIRAN